MIAFTFVAGVNECNKKADKQRKEAAGTQMQSAPKTVNHAVPTPTPSPFATDDPKNGRQMGTITLEMDEVTRLAALIPLVREISVLTAIRARLDLTTGASISAVMEY